MVELRVGLTEEQIRLYNSGLRNLANRTGKNINDINPKDNYLYFAKTALEYLAGQTASKERLWEIVNEMGWKSGKRSMVKKRLFQKLRTGDITDSIRQLIASDKVMELYHDVFVNSGYAKDEGKQREK